MKQLRIPRRQRGFLIIAAVFLLVVLAGLVAYLMTVSTTSQAASAADFNSARAYQAARAGAEWGAYQILRNPGGETFKSNCDAATELLPETRTLNFASPLPPFAATVRCSSVCLTEGAAICPTGVKAYRIVSNGCNQLVCPTVTTSATYAERQVSLSLTK